MLPFSNKTLHGRSKYITSENSVVGMETGRRTGRPRNLSSIPGRSTRFVSSPKHPDRFLGSFSLLSSGYKGLFLGGKAARVWSWLPIPSMCRGKEWQDLYLHPTIHSRQT